jgi:hypothetical protein
MKSPALSVPIKRATVLRIGFIVVLAVAGAALLLQLADEMRRASRSGQFSQIMAQASSLSKALYHYGEDHEGRFPVGRDGATHAFRELIAGGYLTDETLFFVPGSAWHEEAPLRRPDNDIGTKPDFAQALERGENHWAYVSGLTTESASNLPLIADGFVEGAPGRYTDDPSKKGGLWKGTKAIVVFVSGSVVSMPLSAEDGFRVLRRRPDGSQEDIFTPEGGLPEAARVLNPW